MNKVYLYSLIKKKFQKHYLTIQYLYMKENLNLYIYIYIYIYLIIKEIKLI